MFDVNYLGFFGCKLCANFATVSIKGNFVLINSKITQ